MEHPKCRKVAQKFTITGHLQNPRHLHLKGHNPAPLSHVWPSTLSPCSDRTAYLCTYTWGGQCEWKHQRSSMGDRQCPFQRPPNWKQEKNHNYNRPVMNFRKHFSVLSSLSSLPFLFESLSPSPYASSPSLPISICIISVPISGPILTHLHLHHVHLQLHPSPYSPCLSLSPESPY